MNPAETALNNTAATPDARESAARGGPYVFLLIFVLLAAGIFAAGYGYYRIYEKDYRAGVERQLSAIADMKVSDLTRWRKERLGDAGVLFQNAALFALVQRFFEKPEDADAQRQLQAWLAQYEAHFQYDQARLLDPQGMARLSSPAGLPAVPSAVAECVSEVLRSGRVMFQDFYRSELDQRVYLGLLIPIVEGPNSSRTLGVLYLRIDPEIHLYPFIKRWPTLSESAETLLVRREGNEVVFLNELRFQANTALKLRAPLDRVELPAAHAALGQEGIVEGMDYRGKPVVAALRAIPDSPWSLVARMDTVEVNGPIRAQMWQVVGMIGMLLLAAGACLGLVWRRRRVRFFQERAETAEALRASEVRYRRLFEAARDGILILDAETGMVVDVNPFLVELLGFSREYFLSRKVWELGFLRDIVANQANFAELQRKEYIRYEDLALKASDGREIQVEFVSNVYLVNHRKVIQCNIRDITERKAHQAEIERMNRLYATLSQVNQTIVRCKLREELFPHLCRVAVEFGQFKAVSIVLRTAGTEQTPCVAHHAAAPDASLTLPGQAQGCEMTAEAMRAGRPCISNDAQHDERTACCHAALAGLGARSCAAFPFHFQGEVCGAVCICSREAGSFNPDEVRLLEEVAFDISYALEHIEQEAERKRAEESLRQSRAAALNMMEDAISARDRAEKSRVELEREVEVRKRSEAAMRESEARYRALFETSTDGILVADIETKAFRYSNPAACRMFGYDEEQWRTIGVADIHPKDALPSVLAEFEAQARGEKDLAPGLPCLRKDGTVFFADVCAVGVTIDGRACNVGFFRDITERKRAEAELARLNQQHKLILSSAAEGILGLDLRGNHTFINSAAARMLGYEAEELLGRPSHSVWHHTKPDGSPYPQEECEISAAYRDGVVHRSSTEVFWRKDGASFPVECASTPIYEQGRLVGAVVTFTDITERKRAEVEHGRLEEQLRVSQKMEAIGNLAGGVAHDFNNLLSVILGYTEFAIEEARENDLLKNNLLEVKKAGERATALTRQLLAFGRRQVLQPVPLSLNEIAVGIEKMLRRILGEDIDLVQALAPDLGVVRADPGQIEQVLMNLVVNARDAMPEGGKLTIETSNVELDGEYVARHVAVQPGSYVQLAVTDTGCGMDEQTKARLFEPFFTTKEKGRGTGLGLSTVYGIVKQSGGNIWVYSELGRGTTFKIYLPRDLSATAAAIAKPSSVPRWTTGTETILVVEDEEGLRKIARKALDAAGYKVLTAADGEEALLISAQHAGDIHLLLTDVVMPGMSGRVVAEHLTKMRPTLKVLYMSGYTDNAIIHHGVLDTGTHFLVKPFTVTVLAGKVREVLDEGIAHFAEGQEKAVRADAEIRQQHLDKDALQALPPDVLAKLRKAVIAVRYDEIVELIEGIRLAEPDVAAGLLRMADLFDYDRLRNLLSE